MVIMKNIIKLASGMDGVTDNEIRDVINELLETNGRRLKKILLLPPDFTRMHSGAGKITAMIYSMLQDTVQVDVLPALGTHVPMTKEETDVFFEGVIPFEKVIPHRWREDVVPLGEIPASYVAEVSDGLISEAIPVEINKLLLDKSYDLIISIGQVVPHEVVGMANYTKNILVGCGGKDTINISHMLGAVFGMEKVMGKDHSPVRKVFDYAQENFLNKLPLTYILTVTTSHMDKVKIEGIFAGKERHVFEEAVKQSREKNLTWMDKPIKKAVVYLDPREFKSTWLGNKAIYRTRMAMADGGELIILAPGVRKFGEDDTIDTLIRKYGYKGREYVLKQYNENADLRENPSAAAHLIHGSSDGRFKITYAVSHLTKEEVESVGFNYMSYDEATKKYKPEGITDGYYNSGDDTWFYISNPALGLWTVS
jgi:nickel-dependent lactate racemase